MKRIAEIDPTVESVLRTGNYDTLAIKRIDHECFLLITSAGVPRVLAKSSGTAITFRHAWQIRDWLQSQFGITTDHIEVETYS